MTTSNTEPFLAARLIKEIGRGKNGARSMTRDDAHDLYQAMLDGRVSDLELGGILLSMRIKGESVEEIAGFLDAAEGSFEQLTAPPGQFAPVCIPSYNGARKMANLTPLLAMLLAREGVPVLVHGTATETKRVFASEVLALLGVPTASQVGPIAPGEVAFVPTEVLNPGLKRLLDVRRTIGLRNTAHSLVKLMNPVAATGKTLIVSSYTHPEYAVSMAATFAQTQANALLLRGTEGESVADPRRSPQMQGFIKGECVLQHEGVKGTLPVVPDLPTDISAASTAAFIQAVLAGTSPLPPSIAQQVEHILLLVKKL